jgi:hypothetical protein
MKKKLYVSFSLDEVIHPVEEMTDEEIDELIDRKVNKIVYVSPLKNGQDMTKKMDKSVKK